MIQLMLWFFEVLLYSDLGSWLGSGHRGRGAGERRIFVSCGHLGGRQESGFVVHLLVRPH